MSSVLRRVVIMNNNTWLFMSQGHVISLETDTNLCYNDSIIVLSIRPSDPPSPYDSIMRWIVNFTIFNRCMYMALYQFTRIRRATAVVCFAYLPFAVVSTQGPRGWQLLWGNMAEQFTLLLALRSQRRSLVFSRQSTVRIPAPFVPDIYEYLKIV